MFGIEKMFAPKVGDKKSEEVTPTPEKSSAFDKAAKMATLLALLNMPMISVAEGKAGTNPDQKSDKIEDVRLNLKNLLSLVETSTDSKVKTLGSTNLKAHSFASGEEVMVADGNKFVMISQDNNSRLFFDDNADGVLDRLVINKDVDPQDSSDKKFMTNSLYVFDSVKNIVEQNDITADIKPEAVTLFALDQANKKLSIVDGATSGSLEKEGDEALPYLQKVQSKYATLIESLSKGGN